MAAVASVGRMIGKQDAPPDAQFPGAIHICRIN